MFMEFSLHESMNSNKVAVHENRKCIETDVNVLKLQTKTFSLKKHCKWQTKCRESC